METRNRGDFLAKMSHVYELSSIFLDKEVDYMLFWNHPSQYCLYEIGSAIVNFTGNDGWNSPGDKKGFQPQ